MPIDDDRDRATCLVLLAYRVLLACRKKGYRGPLLMTESMDRAWYYHLGAKRALFGEFESAVMEEVFQALHLRYK